MSAPKLLDLFCCAGGAGTGYRRAGFDVTGVDVGTYVGPEAMGIDWMNGNELCEAIPPVYTEVIGHQLLAAIAEEAAA